MTEPDPNEKSRRDALREALASVATEPSRPSLTDEVFALLDDIEAAMRNGASIEELRQALAEQGLSTTKAGFNSALYRARQRRAKLQAPPARASPPTTSGPAPTRPKRPGPGATKAERDAYSASVISNQPSNPFLEKRLKKEKGEE